MSYRGVLINPPQRNSNPHSNLSIRFRSALVRASSGFAVSAEEVSGLRGVVIGVAMGVDKGVPIGVAIGVTIGVVDVKGIVTAELVKDLVSGGG